MTTEYRIKKARRETVLNKQRRVAAMLLIAVVLLAWMMNCGLLTTEAADSSFTYVSVKSGDTIWGIAGKYNSKQTDIRDFVRMIAEENRIDNYVIHEGQTLRIPQ